MSVMGRNPDERADDLAEAKAEYGTIRPYGPGKFNTILDAYVYGVSLDGGCDEEVGSVDEGGWYGLMRVGSSIFRDHDPMLKTLNPAERDAVADAAGVILFENSDGFVEVTFYATEEALNKAWTKVDGEHQEEGEEGDEANA